jgi:tetratricopeptide (TPR) repeat protein
MKAWYVVALSCALFLSAESRSEGLPEQDQVRALIQKYQYGKALELIDNSLNALTSEQALSPIAAELYASKGFVLRELYAFDRSVVAYRKAFELDSTNDKLLIDAAGACKLVQDYPGALALFDRAINRDTANQYLQLERANCELLSGQYMEAIGDFGELWHRDSLNVHAVKSMGFCFNKLQQIETAINFYQIALQILPIDPGTVMSLANLYLKTKNYEAGIQVTEDFRSLNPGNREVNSMNALFYLSNKDNTKAIERFQACIAAGDSSELNYKNLGIAYYSINEYDTAKSYLEKAYELDPTNVSNLHYLGISCYRSFYKELGIRYLEEAIQLYASDEDKIALVYKNYSEACVGWSSCPADKKLNALLTAYRFNPTDSLLALHLADFYEQAKLYSTAAEYFETYFRTLPTPDKDNPRMKSRYQNFESRLQKLKEQALTEKSEHP